MNPTIEEKVRRPVKHLAAMSRKHPDLWKLVDKVRNSRSQISQSYHWPAWCYLPIGAALGILHLDPLTERIDPKVVNQEASFAATLAAWRVAKDVYVFDDTVHEELWNTPIEGQIPIEVLQRLPTLCAYIAFPSPRDMGRGPGWNCHGFFVHLNYSKRPVLEMNLDFGDADHFGLAAYIVELHEGKDLLQCAELMHARVPVNMAAQLAEQYPQMTPEELEAAIAPGSFRAFVEPLLSLTVYLCSTSAEIRAQDPYRGLRREAYSKKTKQGVRTFVPDQPRIWEVAFRIGATLRAAASSTAHGKDQGGSHASPRPHIRRAHWHSYWTGPKAAVGKLPVPPREIVVKWIPPTPVAMGPDGEIVPTVHRVTR